MRNKIDNRFGNRTREIRDLARGASDPEAYASVQKWIAQCYNRPSPNELIMCAFNEILDGYGVEVVRSYNWDNFYGDAAAVYVNVGDTYDNTIVYEVANDRYITTTLGDWVEANERRLALV